MIQGMKSSPVFLEEPRCQRQEHPSGISVQCICHPGAWDQAGLPSAICSHSSHLQQPLLQGRQPDRCCDWGGRQSVPSLGTLSCWVLQLVPFPAGIDLTFPEDQKPWHQRGEKPSKTAKYGSFLLNSGAPWGSSSCLESCCERLSIQGPALTHQCTSASI